MGNTNSHVSERRKSTGGGLVHGSTSGTGASPASDGQGSSSAANRNSTSGLRGSVGPVDITKPSNVGRSPNRLLSGAGSAISRTVRGLRPWSSGGSSGGGGGGDSSSSSRPRTRANTISSSQRPHWSRRLFSGFSEEASSTRENAPGGGGSNAQESSPVPSNLPAEAAAMCADAAATVSGGDKRLPTIFKYPGPAKEVYICGSFNNWQKLKMSQSTKDFVAIVELGEGEHEYKFFVDGEWKTDPNQPPAAAATSMIRVQKEDFNAYHALDMDSRAVAMAQQNQNRVADTYGQEIPPISSRADGGQERRRGPPILPPHLLQVVLNKDTPLACEPTLLPLPKRVMLNHLYALSIKDGVMVLSTTQRYKKKFVTTLLYKPMDERKD